MLELPLVILLEQDGSDEARDAVLVGEDADDVGSALDLLGPPLERLVECSFERCCSGRLCANRWGVASKRETAMAPPAVILCVISPPTYVDGPVRWDQWRRLRESREGNTIPLAHLLSRGNIDAFKRRLLPIPSKDPSRRSPLAPNVQEDAWTRSASWRSESDAPPPDKEIASRCGQLSSPRRSFDRSLGRRLQEWTT